MPKEAQVTIAQESTRSLVLAGAWRVDPGARVSILGIATLPHYDADLEALLEPAPVAGRNPERGRDPDRDARVDRP
jgi:hypothetical protein